MEVSSLSELIEQLVPLYEPDTTGKALVEYLQEDWLIFSEACTMKVELLDKILQPSGFSASSTFRRFDAAPKVDATRWNSLREELAHTNRFFPKNEPAREDLKQALELSQYEMHKGTVVFRARIDYSGKSFKPSEMGAPPSKLAGHGRANPAGIPYLYVASTLDAAVEEVRPQRGDIVVVATGRTNKQLTLVDLRNPRETINPFGHDSTDYLKTLLADMPFLEDLGRELSRPISQNAAGYEYSVSQYLCEFIKQANYDGVLYRSCHDNSFNVACYDVKCVTFNKVSNYQIEKLEVRRSVIK